ncbi:MAG: MFS transporter [Candidatus Aminicenantes bacterium]|nr:MFS transporter [Candidatus Aminicenantes bacterium]
MAVLGVSSITPAFPVIIEDLGISTQSIGLLITVFTLPGIFLTPVLGALADRFGRKRILVPSMILFGLAGGACALVRDFQCLLVLRFFQGVGAASLGSLNITIVGDLFSGNERTTAMGYNASVLSVGTASYPAIGGVLATAGWHYPFFLPLAAVPLGLWVLFSLKNPEPEKEQDFKQYLHSAWKSIKKRQVVVLLIAISFTFVILYGSYLTYFPLLLSHKFKATPLVIGLLMSVMSLTTAVTSSQLGKLAKTFTKKNLIKAAYVLYGAALVIFPFIPSLWLLLIPTILFGLAHGVNIPSLQTRLAELAPMKYRAAFMSVNGMVLRLGQTLGPVLMGLVYVGWGIEGAICAGAGFSAAALLLLVFVE